MDVRRLVVCAASALVCAAMCASAAWGAYHKDFGARDDFSGGIGQRVEYSEALGGITLVKASMCVPFLWIPSGDEGVVCKVDARSGTELGRYRVGAESEGWAAVAVAPDASGAACVACSSANRPGRIVRISAGNSGGLTSVDTNSDNRIASFETLQWGRDSLVRLVAEVGGADSAPAALAFDTRGALWVSLSNERRVVRVDLGTGETTATVPVQGKPNEMLVDGAGFLWVLCRDARMLCKIDTLIGMMVDFYPLGDCSPSGMCLDSRGNVCLGNTLGGLIEFSPDTGVATKQELGIDNSVSAVAIDRDGGIWATVQCRNEIWRFSKDYEFMESVPVGNGPASLCCDDDGYIWVLNRSGASATRVDPRTDKPVLNVRTCCDPYTTTPFAAAVVKRGMSPDGEWRTVLDSRTPGAGWGVVFWDAVKVSGSVSVDVRSAEQTDGLRDSAWESIRSGDRFGIPNGRYMELRVRLTSWGGASPVLTALSVEGINLPPDVSRAAPSLARLPFDEGKLEPVEVLGVRDPEGDPVTIKITGVTQDEPTADLREDDKGPDATGVGGACVWVRGECDTGTADSPGNGRVYVISFTATDSHGATADGKVRVGVPRGHSSLCKAVDDGQKYDSARMLDTRAVAEDTSGGRTPDQPRKDSPGS